MPCYEVRIVAVQFKIGNIKLLEEALEREGCRIHNQSESFITFSDKAGTRYTINFDQSSITKSGSQTVTEKQLSSFANSIKRSYSAVVIDEVARRKKWMKKEMGKNLYQLNRY